MLFYKVKNKRNGNIETVTSQAKAIIEKNGGFKEKFQLLYECDSHGREFNFNNFLTEVNGKESIESGIGQAQKEEKQEFGNGLIAPGINDIIGNPEQLGNIKGSDIGKEADDNNSKSTGKPNKPNKRSRNK